MHSRIYLTGMLLYLLIRPMAVWHLSDALTVFTELGTTEWTITYEYCKNINHDTLLKKHSDDLLKYFRIYVSEDKKCFFFFGYFI